MFYLPHVVFKCGHVMYICIYWSKYWKGWTIEWVMRLPPQGVTSNIKSLKCPFLLNPKTI